LSRAAFGLAALALAVPLVATALTRTYGGELAAGYDSNVGNAANEHDLRDSPTAYAAFGVLDERRFGLFTALQLQAGISTEQYTGQDGLSNLGGQVRVQLLHKPGRGFSTPVLGAWLAVGGRDYDSEIRDSSELRAGVSAAVPATTAVKLRAEVQWSRRESDGRAFDLEQASYALLADWAASERVTVYGGVRLNSGQYAVTAKGEGEITPKHEHRYLEPRADVIEADAAFGNDWWAFRIENDTWIGTLGFNLPLGSMMALDAQVQRSQSGMGKFTYERWLGSLGLVFRW
jgi:hypothetical protein